MPNKLDGAPAWYWQVYADDEGPFVFPLPSIVVDSVVGRPSRSRRFSSLFLSLPPSWLIAWLCVLVGFVLLFVLPVAAMVFGAAACTAGCLAGLRVASAAQPSQARFLYSGRGLCWMMG